MTRQKLITKAVVIPSKMFAVFHVSWLEADVCFELKNENAIEHCRLPQYDTEQST